MIGIESQSTVDLRTIIQDSNVANIAGGEDLLRQCIHRSAVVRYGLVNDRVACVLGLIPPTLLSERAYIWMLATKLVDAHKFLFVRYSQRWMEEALNHYSEIYGDMVGENESTRRWLRWLGADFNESIGVRTPFVIRRKNG